MQLYKREKQKKIQVMLPTKKEILVNHEIMNEIISNMIGPPNLNSNAQTIMGSACRLLIDREKIKPYYFRFPENVPLMEDLIFCLKVFLDSEKVSIDQGIYYHYMTNDNSAIRKHRENMLEMQMDVHNKISNILIKNEVDEVYEFRLNMRYVEGFLTSIANEVSDNNPKKFILKLKEISNMCSDKRLRKIIESVDTSGYLLRKKIILLAIQRKWSIYLYLYYKILFKKINK
ncbi:hypothetical protein LZ578_09820 [Jeotgalibaca sp. MA1X17-3]|uniref:hypothetical protein n=1 Tax=Jeotgalibaca sp. MA1X17-3 TaxID=2908211 RepID=UPI001F1D5F6E|nr:hypothetical protein [Jeotgalibaca sp. MA1X17-3]UJF15260.1 hypothetical protein LZ578_09820 [Jeotgalibaca sp. MA1X17-3]